MGSMDKAKYNEESKSFVVLPNAGIRPLRARGRSTGQISALVPSSHGPHTSRAVGGAGAHRASDSQSFDMTVVHEIVEALTVRFVKELTLIDAAGGIRILCRRGWYQLVK